MPVRNGWQSSVGEMLVLSSSRYNQVMTRRRPRMPAVTRAFVTLHGARPLQTDCCSSALPRQQSVLANT